MHLSLSETNYQKRFLATVSEDTRSYFKIKFNDFNDSANIDHNISKYIFNIINTEIVNLKEQLNPLEDSFISFQNRSEDQKRELLKPNEKSFLQEIFEHRLIVEYKFNYDLKELMNEKNYLFSKFTSSLDFILLYSGLYEELYIINTLNISVRDWHLSYSDSIYNLSNGKTKISFQVFPLFFIIKKLLLDNISEFAFHLILEHLLENLDYSIPYFLTISDEEDIKEFYKNCNLKLLTNYALKRLEKHNSLKLPKILNITQLPF